MLRVKLKVKGQGNVDNKDEQEDRSNLLHIPSVIKVGKEGGKQGRSGFELQSNFTSPVKQSMKRTIQPLYKSCELF